MNLVAALFCGALFGFGLALSGMTDISRVIGFLDLFGGWDPTLGFVMGSGLLIAFPFFQLGVGRMSGPVFDQSFRIPTRGDVDAKLITGAALFGIGWGLVGLCPGPVIASFAYLNPDFIWFALAMVVGMVVADMAGGLFEGQAQTN